MTGPVGTNKEIRGVIPGFLYVLLKILQSRKTNKVVVALNFKVGFCFFIRFDVTLKLFNNKMVIKSFNYVVFVAPDMRPSGSVEVFIRLNNYDSLRKINAASIFLVRPNYI